MKYVFNFKQLSICTWRLINTCACVKFLQVLQIVHRYLWTTLTYLQNICKLVTDILQIRENLLQIIAVLSQTCYRYWQIFNIYVSLVREYIKSGMKFSHRCYTEPFINAMRTASELIDIYNPSFKMSGCKC